MAYDEASRGKSKGLELIYAPIQESNMSRPLSQFTKPVVIGTTTKRKAISIFVMNLENYHLSALWKS